MTTMLREEKRKLHWAGGWKQYKARYFYFYFYFELLAVKKATVYKTVCFFALQNESIGI